MPTYGQLSATHPSHDDARLREYRALASGGHVLLGDDALMARVFPQHAHEPAWVYAERKRRAIYLPYAGEIVGELCAQLGADPLVARAEPSADSFFEQFVDDIDRRGTSLSVFAQALVRTALVDRIAWTLVDLPAIPGDEPQSLAEQERSGGLRAYLCPLDASAVTDWEEDEQGALTWACVRSIRATRSGPADDRSDVVERFTVYYPDRWERYELSYKAGRSPRAKTDVPMLAQGAHTFGSVPLVRLELPEGLWALDKLAPVARAHLNLCSAIDWSQNKHLFPMMMAFLAPDDAGGAAGGDPARATQQTYGTGWINTFGKDDRIEYVAPDTGVYEHALGRLSSLRDEMHRVCHAMALAVDNSAGAMGRSGESKAEDRAAKEVVIRELGRLARDTVRRALVLAQRGRGDEVSLWNVSGFERFDPGDEAEAITAALAADSLEIPSPTFRQIFLTATAQRIVRRHATPEQLVAIRDELEQWADEQRAEPSDSRVAATPAQVPAERATRSS